MQRSLFSLKEDLRSELGNHTIIRNDPNGERQIPLIIRDCWKALINSITLV